MKGFFRTPTRVRLRTVVLAVVLAAAALLIAALAHRGNMNRMQKELVDYQQQIKEANAEEETLRSRLEFMETDAYIAQEARQRFGYMAPEELRFYIDDGASADTPIVLPATEPSAAPEGEAEEGAGDETAEETQP